MTPRITTRSRLAIQAAVIVLAIAAVTTPAARSIILCGLVEFADMTERVVRIPCWLMDHTRCFSLDRFDPTCPQCL